MIVPKIRIEQVFTSSDNTRHDTIKNAQLHECGLELRRIAIDNGMRDDAVRTICLHMAKNYEKYSSTIDAIRRIRRK